MTVYDAQGCQVASVLATEIDLSEHPPGLYTAVITTAQGSQAVRLVVVR